MKKFFKHLHKVNKHRFQVFKLCCKCGLFKRGLLHDLSKYSPTEFFESVKYFTDGKRSSLEQSRDKLGYSPGWLHHKGRNKHHIEYWYDERNEIQPLMPYEYAVESVCDRISATKSYKGKDYKPQHVLDYWNSRNQDMAMNPKTRKFFNIVLNDLATYGEKYILNKKYMKEAYKVAIEDEESTKGKTNKD